MSKSLVLGLAAAVAHQINAAYCQAIGDNSQVPWDDAPDEIKASAEMGAKMHLENPDATPEQSHESWLANKLANGWVYGEAKDLEAKTHPCCVPYAELPAEQKAKDYIFRAAVHAVASVAEAVEAESAKQAERIAELEAQITKLSADKPAKASTKPAAVLVTDGVGVKYIGRRDSWTDTIYGTGLTFHKDVAVTLPAKVAASFLSHIDVFAQVEADAAPVSVASTLSEAESAKAKVIDAEMARQEAHTQLRNMKTKAAINDFARTHFQQEFDEKLKLDEMREKAATLLDQFGLAQ